MCQLRPRRRPQPSLVWAKTTKRTQTSVCQFEPVSVCFCCDWRACVRKRVRDYYCTNKTIVTGRASACTGRHDNDPHSRAAPRDAATRASVVAVAAHHTFDVRWALTLCAPATKSSNTTRSMMLSRYSARAASINAVLSILFEAVAKTV